MTRYNRFWFDHHGAKRLDILPVCIDYIQGKISHLIFAPDDKEDPQNYMIWLTGGGVNLSYEYLSKCGNGVIDPGEKCDDAYGIPG